MLLSDGCSSAGVLWGTHNRLALGHSFCPEDITVLAWVLALK